MEGLGELRRVEGATWQEDIGMATELAGRRGGPALLFDDIPGYSPGYRVLSNSFGSVRRIAYTLGLPVDAPPSQLLRLWLNKLRTSPLIPPRYVSHGAVMEEVHIGSAVDLLEFPSPIWHEADSGRYLGTGSADITRDPEEGWVNLGTYRVMLHDRNRLGFYISPGKHGHIHREKYFARGEPCPVVVASGMNPLLFLASATEIPPRVCEYDWAGGIRGEPFEVIQGPVTGLPIPADAEIAIEGFAYPRERHLEGPFGEWTGYYASGVREEPVIQVQAVYHRRHPILVGSPPNKPPDEQARFRAFLRSALLLEDLEKAGVPDVEGVWCHEVGGSRLLLLVAIKQRYPGHARQAGHVAAMCHAGAYLGRYVIVVDEDIDVTDLGEVMWAVCTRADPATAIDIIHRAWSGPLDPAIEPGKEGFNSRAIIDACRPYEWRDRFPSVCAPSPEMKHKAEAKWGHLLK